MPQAYQTTITLFASSETELKERLRIFDVFNNKISLENLRMLSTKCQNYDHEKINKKIKTASSFF